MSQGIILALALTLLCGLTLSQASFQMPFNGGNLPNFLHNNPYLMNSMIGRASPLSIGSSIQCSEIPGVGLPILAIKKFLIAVDVHLDSSNINTFVKIIFYKDTKTLTGVEIKLVVAFKTFTDEFYAAIEGELRVKGTQRFRLESYHYDTDIASIREVLNEPTINVNNFVGCGNLKEIYTNFLKSNKRAEFLTKNIPYGQTALPLVPPLFNNQPPTFGLANGNAPNGSQQNAGPFLYNFGGR
jgi:hypothetical protein